MGWRGNAKSVMGKLSFTVEEALEGLFVAAQHGRADVIGVMMQQLNIDDITQQNPVVLYNAEGNTPLIVAVLHQRIDAVRILLTSSFPLGLSNRPDHLTAYQLTLQKDLPSIQQVFHEYLIQQVALENVERIKECFQSGVPINGNDGPINQNSFLHWACNCGSTSVTQLLCEMEANINILNTQSMTPLHEAVYHSHHDCVKVLLDYGAAIDIKGDEGVAEDKTALDLIHDERIRRMFHQKWPSLFPFIDEQAANSSTSALEITKNLSHFLHSSASVMDAP